MHVVAGKAACFREAQQPDFQVYAKSVKANAKALAETLLSGGLSLVSGGTDNHLVLVDVTAKGIGGTIAEDTLGACGITVNKNMIPYDARKPMDPSGIRIGTPALTTRGMGVEQMKQVGQWIVDALSHHEDASKLDLIRGDVKELCQHFPVPATGVGITV
jgi:glycine hydroxymethyltransferase